MKNTKSLFKSPPHFRPKILESFKDYSFKKLSSDILSGIIVALVALPLSITLAMASGVHPIMGIHTSIIAGVITSLLGGSRVSISGPAATCTAVAAGVVTTAGVEGLLLATVIAGVLLVLMGVFKLGSIVKYIPYTVIIGFTAGIAFTIAIGQVKAFLGLSFPEGTIATENLEMLGAILQNITTCTWQPLLVGSISMLLLIVLPKINKKIPGILIAVIVGVVMVIGMEHLAKSELISGYTCTVSTVGHLYVIEGGLPSFALDFSKINRSTIPSLLPSALTLAILSGSESLLCCISSDEMISDKHNSGTELIAQGIGNIFSALFGGLPAAGSLTKTAANVQNNGRTPLSGIVHALVLLVVLLFLIPYTGLIPMPTIAAILIMVAFKMCPWKVLMQIFKNGSKEDIFLLVATLILTVVFTPVVAMISSLLLAAALHIIKNKKNNKNGAKL